MPSRVTDKQRGVSINGSDHKILQRCVTACPAGCRELFVASAGAECSGATQNAHAKLTPELIRVLALQNRNVLDEFVNLVGTVVLREIRAAARSHERVAVSTRDR